MYFGLPRFNARLRADNFTAEELPELMKFLHGHGVKGFVAFNTLVFTGELTAAEEQLAWLQEAGVDAIIVQDLGLASVAKRVAPDVHLHASTQMTITSPEGLALVSGLGLDRAVLARELSLRELERFTQSPVPLEVFVHGALCVAYSGQCLTSESLGQRSANRGECAQACRMPYQVVVDGECRDLGDRRYLLSPQDLSAVGEIPRLIELGVTSFKIEGRLKTPEYVAAVTAVYRKAIDAAVQKQPLSDMEKDRYAMEMTFSRGLFTGWMHGVNHQELVGARFGKKRGAFVGQVLRLLGERVELDRMAVNVQAGDGVVFDTGEDTDREQGGFVYHVQGMGLEFQRGKLDLRRIPIGTRVWKTSDPFLDKKLRATFKGNIPIRKHKMLRCRALGNVGSPLVLHALSAEGEILAGAESSMPLQEAVNQPLTTELLTAQLSRLGGTPWELVTLQNDLVGAMILPISELGRMRRLLIQALESQETAERPKGNRGIMAAALQAIAQTPDVNGTPPTMAAKPEISLLCRTMEQAEVALGVEVSTVYVDFEDIRKYASAVKLGREYPESRLILATPRIQKPAEEGVFKLMARTEPAGVLVRNLGSVQFFKDAGIPMIGDFSLNVANPLSAKFLRDLGLEWMTISSDLNADQSLDLLAAAPPSWFELILHQHMPMFHMEHCVFAAFLSKGKTALDCGRPCEKHEVRLRDRVGMEHPLVADVGCRNTLFNAVAQTGAKYFEAFVEAGLRKFRVELLRESPEETQRIIEAYRDLLAGRASPETLWQALRANSQLGVTSGTLRGQG